MDFNPLFFIIYFNNNTWGRSKVGWDPVGGRSRLFEWARSLPLNLLLTPAVLKSHKGVSNKEK